MLYEVITNALVARVKILSGLDITERRVPQDGRIKMKMGRNRSVDFRVSSLPTLFGESVVLRILDKGSLNVDLTKLGFEKETFAALKRCLHRITSYNVCYTKLLRPFYQAD